jgi:hypothetical protein
MSMLCDQILFSDTVLLEKEQRLLGEISDSRTGAGQLQDKPGAFLNAIK